MGKSRTTPSAASLESLAEVLGVSVDEFRPIGPPAESISEGLADFMRSQPPPDLTEKEVCWLATVPETCRRLTAADYARLLLTLRNPAQKE